MLYTEAERRLMAAAVQPNMRVDMPTAPFENIVRDFGLRFPVGGRILDLGPGQCDLLDIARRAGAATVGIDNDPACSALGSARGHEMIQANMRPVLPAAVGRCDGIFCRGSINVYWFQRTPDRLQAFLDSITSALVPTGWLWIVPWNKPLAEPGAEAIDAIVDRWRADHGIRSREPSAEWKKVYSLRYDIPRTEVWTLGLAA